jgi:hypothetical protein
MAKSRHLLTADLSARLPGMAVLECRESNSQSVRSVPDLGTCMTADLSVCWLGEAILEIPGRKLGRQFIQYIVYH